MEALSKHLLTNYLIYVKAGGNKVVKKTAKPAAGIISIVSKAISFSAGPLSFNFNELKKIFNVFETKDMVICLDDLERCSIPICELLGFVNNLIEHCNCKVLILADESNIGKIYANTNVEQKYQTLLTGSRKVVQNRPSDGALDKNNSDELTIKQLKELNESLYSENFIYRDIKEKVIGKTLNYTPQIKDIVKDVILGTEKVEEGVKETTYKNFLLENIDLICSCFLQVDNRNVRTIIAWIDMYYAIYHEVDKNFRSSKYSDDITSDFLRYSIWSIVSQRKNTKLVKSAYYGRGEFVHVEGNEYNHICRYEFIDRYLNSEHLDVAALVQSAREIEARTEREKIEKGSAEIQSTGVEYGKLCNWRYLDDKDVKNHAKAMLEELRDGKYAYKDFSNILALLVFFKRIKLFSGALSEVQKMMLLLIEKDDNVQEERGFPQSFHNNEDRANYEELYATIAAKRKERNAALEKNEIAEEDSYRNADAFCKHCELRKNYYCDHRTFLEYVDKEKLMELIKKSDLNGIYSIEEAFSDIYYMENVKDFYLSDIISLQEISDALDDYINNGISGVTRQIAYANLKNTIKEILAKLS